jgi:hypothetical protein
VAWTFRGATVPITFKDNGKDKVPESVTGPVRVLDPVNAENNVAARIDEDRRKELVAACREAFEALAAAQTAPTAAVARAYYQRVFGPAFALPPDTPARKPPRRRKTMSRPRSAPTSASSVS